MILILHLILPSFCPRHLLTSLLPNDVIFRRRRRCKLHLPVFEREIKPNLPLKATQTSPSLCCEM
eukprot:m.79993 g.79993  ORF g.79993 m.79993 type:complete len:65 (+) comp36158_c0_seq2:6145-6339(+)